MTILRTLTILACLAASPSAQEPGEETGSAGLKVEAIHVFKDGHALVVRSGVLPVDAEGRVIVDDLPAAILGCFWPAVVDRQLTLESVVAATREVPRPRAARTIPELIFANPGRRVRLVEIDGAQHEGTIASASAGQAYVLIASGLGETRALPIDRVREVVFLEEPGTELAGTERRNVLELRLGRPRDVVRDRVAVRLLTVEKGFRWAPSWRLDLAADRMGAAGGRVAVSQRATLVNDLVDIDGARVHLVVGVPSFRFADLTDPMAMQAAMQTMTQADAFRNDRYLSAASNVFTSQVVVPTDEASRPADVGPAADEGARVDDLFVFDVGPRTLGKGARMTLLLNDFEIAYEDVWVLDVPISVPEALLPWFRNQRRSTELERLAAAPKAEHRLRLINDRGFPFTTGPALVLKDGHAIAQGLITYTSPGATCDLALTRTVDVGVRFEDVEVDRKIDALTVDGRSYQLLVHESRIHLVNRSERTVVVDVRRWLPGEVVTMNEDGTSVRTNPLLAEDDLGWSGWGWPSWYALMNGYARATWLVTLAPGEHRDLVARWKHYWR